MSGKRLSTLNIFALGFMTFALFVGAGNIIFPPMVGLQSGQHVFIAAIGFLITGVGLPVLTIVALAKVGGGLEHLSAPIGKVAALILAIVCYLAVGPLFATPRTATVSFEVGIAPLTGSGHFALLIYSIIYFVIVCLVALYPGKLLDIVGRFLAPIKMLALAILAIAAVFWPAGHSIPAITTYQASPFSNGFVNGYLTMDTLGALVFGIVIVNAARSKEVTAPHLLTRYAIYAAMIAGIALMLIYICLFRLGSSSGSLIPNAINGAQILHAYVQYTFGDIGSIFLAVLIFLACIVTAIGLTCACAEFFSQYVPLNYPTLVIILAFFSMVVSNLGLSQLINFSVPILTAIYPPCIILIILSFMHRLWIKPHFVIAPVTLMSFIFGVVDGINASELHDILPTWIVHLPLFQQGLAWLIPSVVVLVIMMFCHKLRFRALQ